MALLLQPIRPVQLAAQPGQHPQLIGGTGDAFAERHLGRQIQRLLQQQLPGRPTAATIW